MQHLSRVKYYLHEVAYLAKPKSLKEINEDLLEMAEMLGLPLGVINKQRPLKAPTKSKKRGKLPTSPAPPGDEVRFRPTMPFRSEPIMVPSVPTIPSIPEVKPMMNIIEEVINNPAIRITEDMLPAINDPGVGMQNGMLFGQFTRKDLLPKKRKVSKYQKEFGRQLKLLKKKHPRIPVTRLMKRAHAATRKALK